MTLWLGVALLGALGAAVRVTVATRLGAPRGTLAVNVVGAFALGLLVGADAPPDVVLLLGGGLLGALTTYSTWIGEVVERRSPVLLIGAALGGLGAAALGFVLGSAL